MVLGAVTALLFPGLGVLIIPAIVGGDHQWGGLGWVAFWTLPAVLAWYLPREHRVEGDALVSHYRRRTVQRPLADVVELGAAPFHLPAARMTFADGARVWVFGRHTDPFLAAVRERATFVADRLPQGNWLRPRRILWFVVLVAMSALDA